MSEYEGKYKATDFLDTPIEVGDLVVYPVRRGSLMELKVVRVSQIRYRGPGPLDHTVEGINDMGRRVTLLHTNRLIVKG